MIICAQANPSDIDTIVALVNASYRGESSRAGWTTEADWVEGLRTDPEHTRQLLTGPNSVILLARRNQQVLGSILLEYLASQHAAAIGMFAVQPKQQNQGIGKQLLAYAERFACQQWAVQRLQLQVIPWRTELIAFYIRRGYCHTEHSEPFPHHPLLWRAKCAGLTLITLEKIVGCDTDTKYASRL